MKQNFAARVVDNTHFSFTYVETGISSDGTYTVSGDVITVYIEN